MGWQMEVTIDFSKITDGESFHREFMTVMGFDKIYGKDKDAWIDYMSRIDNPKAGLSEITVKPGESLDIKLVGAEAAMEKTPELILDFLECTAYVNERFEEWDVDTRLKLIFKR